MIGIPNSSSQQSPLSSSYIKSELSQIIIKLFSVVISTVIVEFISAKTRSSAFVQNDIDPIKAYGTDLSKLNTKNKLNPALKRERELQTIQEALIAGENCLICGDAEVGKTAIIHKLVKSISEGQIAGLKRKKMISLNLLSLVGHTQYHGQLEGRLKNLINKLKNRRDIIILIDNIHTWTKNDSKQSSCDIVGRLTSYFKENNIQYIATTTPSGLSSLSRNHSDLITDLTTINISPLSQEDSLSILIDLKPTYEELHHCQLADTAIQEAVQLSERYFPERPILAQAIRLIQQACSKTKNQDTKALPPSSPKVETTSMLSKLYFIPKNFIESVIQWVKDSLSKLTQKSKNSQTPLPVIDGAAIKAIAEELTNVPITEPNPEKCQKLLEMEQALQGMVIGQKEAIKAVCDVVKKSYVGLNNPHKPLGVLLFAGPTGVGKTRLAESLACYLFPTNKDSFIRFNMAEYNHADSLTRLIGSNPGYTQYEKGGLLTEQVSQHPFSVVLLDEFEKAHPFIHQFFLAVFDKGLAQDSSGKTINFRNVIFIMTSNVGSDLSKIENKKDDQAIYQELCQNVQEDLPKHFSPEFLNRLDDTCIFHPVTEEMLKGGMIDMEVEKVNQRLAVQRVSISLDNSVKDFLIKIGFNPKMGARPLSRAIETHIVTSLSTALLTNSIARNKTLNEATKIRFSVEHQNIIFDSMID